MEQKRYKPLIDKLFWFISIPTLILLMTATALSVFSTVSLIIVIFVYIFVLYFLISPLVGYVELRGDCLFIKFGFFLKKEIPYTKIRGIEKKRKITADSMLSLKNAMDHVNIKYNKFYVISVSVKETDCFISELTKTLK